jgi:hypothetical protein
VLRPPPDVFVGTLNSSNVRSRFLQKKATEIRFGSFTELDFWSLSQHRHLWQELEHPDYDLTPTEWLERSNRPDPA